MTDLVSPHGGELKQLVVEETRAEKLKSESTELPDWDLSQRQMWDVEMLLNGGFSPLEGFMDRDDYNDVVKKSRLSDGTVWPMPITLDVTDEFVSNHMIDEGSRVALRSPEGIVIAVLEVSDVWRPDREWEAENVFGTTNEDHPAVDELFNQKEDVYVGGKLYGLELPSHHTYQQHRYTPSELRQMFAKRGWTRVVGFQTRNPMHKVHCTLARRAAKKAEANLVIQPVVGSTKPGDIDHHTRVQCYKRVLERFNEQTTELSLLPLSMRMAGPREALWHAIIRQNYGCSHFSVGRDHAGCADSEGNDFYGPYEAQEYVAEFEDELEIEVLTWEEHVFSEEKQAYVPKSEAEEGAGFRYISGTELRNKLRAGDPIPDWFSYPEVIDELRNLYPPRDEQGFTVFFTGLPSSGKSTVAKIVEAKLLEADDRPVTLLDGDIVRKNLSSELGFSKHDRDLNIQRIGFVAGEITKNRGAAICANIAPYEETRQRVRDHITEVGGFVLVHIATPVDVCKKRDRKGLYEKAEKGIIDNFTGINDPYEAPEDPELRIDTTDMKPEEAANRVLLHLQSEGFIGEFRGDGE
jgi:sulfate adenylyltransferase